MKMETMEDTPKPKPRLLRLHTSIMPEKKRKRLAWLRQKKKQPLSDRAIAVLGFAVATELLPRLQRYNSEAQIRYILRRCTKVPPGSRKTYIKACLRKHEQTDEPNPAEVVLGLLDADDFRQMDDADIRELFRDAADAELTPVQKLKTRVGKTVFDKLFNGLCDALQRPGVDSATFATRFNNIIENALAAKVGPQRYLEAVIRKETEKR